MPGAVFLLFDEHSVIEVARGFAVDGDDGQVAEIATTCDLFLIEMRDFARFDEHVLREHMWQVVLANDDFDVYAEVVFVAEDFDNAALGRTRWRGPVGDFDVDDEAFQYPFARWLAEILLSVFHFDEQFFFMPRGFVTENAMRGCARSADAPCHAE